MFNVTKSNLKCKPTSCAPSRSGWGVSLKSNQMTAFSSNFSPFYTPNLLKRGCDQSGWPSSSSRHPFPLISPLIITPAKQLQTSLSFQYSTLFHNKSLIKEQHRIQTGHKKGRGKERGKENWQTKAIPLAVSQILTTQVLVDQHSCG